MELNAKRYPALEALPPLTEADQAAADRIADLGTKNLAHNVRIGHNEN